MSDAHAQEHAPMKPQKPKVVDKIIGAPRYMGQFNILILLLIVFFIMLLTMAPDKSETGPGKYAGDGPGLRPQKNRLKINIGEGKFKFGQYGKARYYASYVDGAPRDEFDSMPPMLPEENTKGAGGGGNTELKTKISPNSTELVLVCAGKFKENSDEMDADLETWLLDFCKMMRSIEESSVILCHCNEFDDPAKDYALAVRRANKIIQFTHEKGNLPFWNLSIGVSIGSHDVRNHALPTQSTEVFMRNPVKSKP